MASKSKSRTPRKKSGANQLSDLGLLDIPDLSMDDAMDIGDDSDVDESTLESELEAIMRGDAIPKRNKPKPKIAPPMDIEKLAAECLRDDDDDEEEDEDLSGNEDLLKELQKLSPEETEKDEETLVSPSDIKTNSENSSPETSEPLLKTLQDRLNLYNEALKVAKLNNDNSKVRRYGRAVKTLENLLKSANTGAEIQEEDIPPVVNIPKPATSKPGEPLNKQTVSIAGNKDDGSPKLDSDKVPLSRIDSKANTSSTSSLLISRQKQYKLAALEAKRAGNRELAINYMRTAKTFDAMIETVNNNQPVDFLSIPPPPPGFQETQKAEINSQKRENQQLQTTSAIEIAALAAANETEQTEIFAAPPAPKTILEALQQRLEKYQLTKQAAETEGNSGKVRRLQRIVKSYETAIKDFKAGKQVDFDELPTPPGFGPIPVETANMGVPTVKETPNEPKAPSSSSTIVKPAAIAEKSNVPQPPTRKPKVQRANTTTGEKQLEFLLERQKLFRQAALSAKQNGDIQQAKEYLRMSKGFDPMIEATKCGLPIDASTIPTPPQLDSDFVIVESSECEENSDLNQEELFENLEKDLLNQLDICSRNKNHFMCLGDVQSASKFEKLALESKKDLSVIKHLKKKGEAAPKFHYETRLFSMVICNTDLNDSEIEVTVERGITLPGKPDELDSYVRLEFPIPTEDPQRAKTHTVRDTNNPVFGENFKFEINRKSRSQLRLFKRHCLKLEVYSKGCFLCCSGFLRSDSLLGTVSVKLVDLESKCLIHDSYSLMDGRKACGGKLEVRVRIRDPLLVKQVEEVREKWLVIGS